MTHDATDENPKIKKKNFLVRVRERTRFSFRINQFVNKKQFLRKYRSKRIIERTATVVPNLPPRVPRPPFHMENL